MKRQELELLRQMKENGKLDTKEYLLRKKEIENMIYCHDYNLKGSEFEHAERG